MGEPRLAARLGSWDAVLLTIGAMVGTGIFLTTSDMARVLPHAGLLLAAWALAGLLTLAGGLTYAELGGLFPRAGGIVHFLDEAYGPFAGFLYGWTCFWVIMSGGIAAIAMGFGEYLGAFLPALSSQHLLASARVGPFHLSLSGAQASALLAIALLTQVNARGVRGAAWVQNVLTAGRIAALVALIVVGLRVPGPVFAPAAALHLPAGHVLVAVGLAMISALWTYDGWYGLTFSAGELRTPGRSLPRGLLFGIAAVILLYCAVNAVYLRALPLDQLAGTTRVAELAALSLFGPAGARLLSATILLSAFGCLASTILYSSRVYLPMAEVGLFFRSLAVIHPRTRTPVNSLWAQSAWSMLLVLSGTYEQLYTYVMFPAMLFHVATGCAVFVLRRTRPDAPRPYRTWGYPFVPALFALASLAIAGNVAVSRPAESLRGMGLLLLGLPAWLFWRGRVRRDARTAAAGRLRTGGAPE